MLRHSPERESSADRDARALAVLISLSNSDYTAKGPAISLASHPERNSYSARHTRPKREGKQSHAAASGGPAAAEQPTDRRVVCIIPAHNEEGSIANTLRSLKAQTRVPDRIVVVADKCTDETVDIARCFPDVSILHIRRNGAKKAGALNKVLDFIVPHLDSSDLILSMDADTVLTKNLIMNAQRHFQRDPRLGALSSNHLVMQHHNLLEILQAMEYERDRRYIGRRGGQGRVYDRDGGYVPRRGTKGRQGRTWKLL